MFAEKQSRNIELLKDSVERQIQSPPIHLLFAEGILGAWSKPIQGIQQLSGRNIDLNKDAQVSSAYAYTAGQMVGSATLFFACVSLFKQFPALKSYGAIATGGLLGFLEPVQNTNKERLLNAARSVTSMMILDRIPHILSGRVFRGDIIGNTAGVFSSGILAGAVDINFESVFKEGSTAGLERTLTSAITWGATGAAMHLGSLVLNKGFHGLAENGNPELIVMGGKRSESSFKARDYLNSVRPDGIKYHQVNTKTPLWKTAVDPEKAYVVFPDGKIVDGTDTVTLAKKLNLHTTPDYDSYRAVVVGAGPAGVQSAVTLASELPEGQKVAVIASRLGGQAGHTSSIKNYMGYSDVSGTELMTNGIKGAKDRGAEFIISQVRNLEHVDGRNVLTLADGTKIKADAVVLATGMKYNQLEVPGMQELTGKGVYTLADASEGLLARGEHVAIVGAGNAAGQAAVNFAAHAKTVDMFVRGKSLEEKMSDYLVREVKSHPNINIHLQTQVASVDGAKNLETVTVKTKIPSGEILSKLKEDALYVYIGGRPNTRFLQGSGIKLDEEGYILTGDQLKTPDLTAQPGSSPKSTRSSELNTKLPVAAQTTSVRPPLPFETSIPGVFAAGDVNAANPWKRIVGAVSDGGRLMDSLEAYLPQITPVQSSRIGFNTPKATEPLSERFAVPLPHLVAPMLQSAQTQSEKQKLTNS